MKNQMFNRTFSVAVKNLDLTYQKNCIDEVKLWEGKNLNMSVIRNLGDVVSTSEKSPVPLQYRYNFNDRL